MYIVTCPHCYRNTDIDATGIDDPNCDYEDVCERCGQWFYVTVLYDVDGYPSFRTYKIEAWVNYDTQ